MLHGVKVPTKVPITPMPHLWHYIYNIYEKHLNFLDLELDLELFFTLIGTITVTILQVLIEYRKVRTWEG